MSEIEIAPWDPEETVGRLWHAVASRLGAPVSHAEAAIDLSSLEGRLAIFFRGLGGGAGVALQPAAREATRHRLSWRRRMSETHERVERTSFDGEALRLPSRIADFPEREDNAALYFWLTAAAAHAAPPVADADALRADLLTIRNAMRVTEAVLADCPGMRVVHRRLCAAALALRPPRAGPESEQLVEAAIRLMLGDPDAPAEAHALAARIADAADPLADIAAPANHRPMLAVPLWPDFRALAARKAERRDDAEPAPNGAPEEAETGARKASRKESDEADRKDSLILFKFEAIFSFADYFNINRKVDDDDAEGAKKAADDADEITLAQVSKRPATRLKLHLDLSPEEADRERLAGVRLLPEWDARGGVYLPDHCRILAVPAPPLPDYDPDALDERARRRIRAVKRQFEALRPARITLPRQMDGEELDLDAAIRTRMDLRTLGHGSDRIWRATRSAERSLSVSILLDASRSTESACGDRTVIDVEREALTALAWGLDACGDEAAIRAFSSLKRDRVHIDEVKDFAEKMSHSVEARIAGLRPGFYTRLGAAVRHVSGELAARPRTRRLLLIVTDGKPNDLDHYDGAHGVEDSRMAVREARRLGHAVHGVLVADKPEGWHSRIFGSGGYSIVSHPEKLSAALPDIYRHLVGA